MGRCLRPTCGPSALSKMVAAGVLTAWLGVASAVPITWTGLGGDNLWSNANNWSPVAIPGPADDVTIGTGATAVSISTSNVTIATLSLQRGLSLAGSRALTVTTATLGATGSIALASGSSLTGTYNINPGGNISFPGLCSFARLSNVTINGDLPAFAGGMRWNNVTLNGTITAVGAGTSEIIFDGSQTVTGNIVASSTGTLRLSANANGTLTIAPGATIQGGTIDFNRSSPCTGGGGTYNIVNNGTIDANVAGRAINFNSGSAVALTNNGTLNINGGTLSLFSASGASGTINLNSGTLNVVSSNPITLGTFNRNAGAVGIFGTCDLGGGTWTPSGSWTISNGAVLQNGSVNLSGSNTIAFPSLCSFGRLSNLTINGDLPAFTGGMRWNNVTLNGTITSVGSGTSEIIFDGSQTVTGNIVASNTGTLRLSANANGTLTIAPGARILGGGIEFNRSSPCTGGGGTYNIVNNGTIDANVAGRTISFNTGSAVALTNNGSVSVGPGSLSLAGGANAGTFLARAGGVFSLGAFAYSFGPESVLDLELKGPPPTLANFGRVTLANNAASTLSLDGALRVRYVAAYTPTCGLEWDIITSALVAPGTPVTGTFSAFDFPFPGEGNLQRVVYEPKTVSFFIATQADFNEDGFITFEDFDEFVSAFEAGEGRSDFNADGFLTFEDFDAFVSKFEGGC